MKQKVISVKRHKKEIDKKDLLIGLLIQHIGMDKCQEILNENDYDIRALAIDQGKKLNQEQIDYLRAVKKDYNEQQS